MIIETAGFHAGGFVLGASGTPNVAGNTSLMKILKIYYIKAFSCALLALSAIF
jgi:hypothetical protein